MLGLIYGIAGFAMMAFVDAAGAAQEVPDLAASAGRRRGCAGTCGSARSSLPLILLHAGFLFGHGLTSVMMWLFVVVSSAACSAPGCSTRCRGGCSRDVPMETIYDQIGHVRAQLLDEADTVVADACGKLEVDGRRCRSGRRPRLGGQRARRGHARRQRRSDETAPLREFYIARCVRSSSAVARTTRWRTRRRRRAMFGKLRPLVRPSFEAAIADLENICEEERQLLRQERHARRPARAGCIVHVPLSFALMVLAVVHIVMALRF